MKANDKHITAQEVEHEGQCLNHGRRSLFGTARRRSPGEVQIRKVVSIPLACIPEAGGPSKRGKGNHVPFAVPGIYTFMSNQYQYCQWLHHVGRMTMSQHQSGFHDICHWYYRSIVSSFNSQLCDRYHGFSSTTLLSVQQHPYWYSITTMSTVSQHCHGHRNVTCH